MSRRVITKTTIDEALASGSRHCVVEDGDIVTALAREYALERGVKLAPAGPAGAAPAGGDEARVKAAVVAALGHTPEGLDAAIAKVLKG